MPNSVADHVPVIQCNSLDSINTVIKLIPCPEHNTKATTSKTRLLVKVCQVSEHSSKHSCMSRQHNITFYPEKQKIRKQKKKNAKKKHMHTEQSPISFETLSSSSWVTHIAQTFKYSLVTGDDSASINFLHWQANSLATCNRTAKSASFTPNLPFCHQHNCATAIELSTDWVGLSGKKAGLTERRPGWVVLGSSLDTESDTRKLRSQDVSPGSKFSWLGTVAVTLSWLANFYRCVWNDCFICCARLLSTYSTISLRQQEMHQTC